MVLVLVPPVTHEVLLLVVCALSNIVLCVPSHSLIPYPFSIDFSRTAQTNNVITRTGGRAGGAGSSWRARSWHDQKCTYYS
jgi:hypothetical protein